MEYQSSGADDHIQSVLEKYAPMVYKLAFARTGQKSDAEDIFQEVFLRYIRKNPVFQSEEHEKAWLIRVTVNCSNRFLSAPFRRRTEPLSDELPQAEKQDLELNELLQRLPETYKVLLHLYYYEGLSVAEIAAALKRKEPTVRMQLTRARRRLKDLWKGEEF